ncbi:membrane protein implicated in regulation of membrane protease activity [Homoserinimonas aerilata]|uniref:Membrane protein implicated in regulation of membrane protease activity n=1 Tax=Homoserinimonas aerilata TaxID=1162970 RepID=A0A542YJG9_9MICO|nr:NfeD family protein [Homoserinimonas aerilata]TQL48114.1 membrane protein implicated in regulation of membrane protease activity [Homoserinimonas aerilata]
MPLEFLSEYAWIVWLAVILVFIIIEVSSLEFTFLMLAIGSLGGLVSGLLGTDGWLQIVIAAVLSVLLLFLLKPVLLRRLHRGGDTARSNIDALIGTEGTVVIDFVDGTGQVRLDNGETWTSRFSPIITRRTADSGDRVVVTTIDGATAIVVPAERNDV